MYSSLLGITLCANWQQISEIPPWPPFDKGGVGGFLGQYAFLVLARPG
jgi:hypothetical protein